MKEFLEIVSEEMKQAFEKAGYPAEYGKVNVSNRPDLCELQCNGAMALAKQFKKAPIMIAKIMQVVLTVSFKILGISIGVKVLYTSMVIIMLYTVPIAAASVGVKIPV